MEAAGELRCLGELDFIDPPALAPLQHQVEFGAVAGAQEMGTPARMGGDQLLNHETLPALTGLRVGQQIVVALDAEQVVQQAAVAQVELGGANQPLAQVGLQRR